MMLRTFPWMVVACALLAGCSWGSSPEREVELMRQDACKGDARAYFKRVNRPRLASNLTRRMVSTARQRGSTATADLAPQKVEKAAQNEVRYLLTEWEVDVARGTHGHLCKMKVARTTDDYVVVRHPTGKTGRWYFTYEDGQFRLTDVK
jgi:hypothetical protein